jgi:predicted small integral membrane protein
MTALALPLAQMVLTGCLAIWMVSGVWNNWRFPHLNEAAVAMVMNFELMALNYPADFAAVAHRKIVNPKVVRAVFYLMVLSETVAAVLLVSGTVALGAALVGVVPLDVARFIALLGALCFTVNWTGFLVGGEYFCYWYCHFGSQATHLLLTLWGTGASAVLLMGQAP